MQAPGVCLERPTFSIGVRSRRDLKVGGFEIYTQIEILDLFVNFFQTQSLFLVALLLFVPNEQSFQSWIRLRRFDSLGRGDFVLGVLPSTLRVLSAVTQQGGQ